MLAINSLVAIYDKQTEAEAGLRDLQQHGFDLKKLSILGREHATGEHVIGYYCSGVHMKYWGARGAFWNHSWKLLSAAGYFVLPDIGPVLVAGPLTTWIVTALKEPLANPVSAPGAALYDISIPMASVLRYEVAVKMHKILFIAHGTARELLQAKDKLHGSRPEEVSIHFADEEVRMAA